MDSIGLWVVGWVGLWVQSFYFAMGWVEEIRPTDNSDSVFFYSAQRLDLFAWCVRLSRLLIGFRTHFKSMHFRFIYVVWHVVCTAHEQRGNDARVRMSVCLSVYVGLRLLSSQRAAHSNNI